jgi:AcrR family transcriptional regulator
VATDTPRRQERGRRRIVAILDAASQLFEEVGYDGATTNSIAARAKISPGSLYQFFPNKRAIADALISRYVADMHAIHETALDPSLGELPLPAMIDRIIDPMVAFHLAHPAARALLAGADVSAELAATTEQLQHAMRTRVEHLIAVAAPNLSRREQARTALMCVQIVKAVLPTISTSGPSERKAVVGELKRALVGYLSTIAPNQRRDR